MTATKNKPRMDTDTKRAFASVFIRVHLWQFAFCLFRRRVAWRFARSIWQHFLFFVSFVSFVVPVQTTKDANDMKKRAGLRPEPWFTPFFCELIILSCQRLQTAAPLGL